MELELPACPDAAGTEFHQVLQAIVFQVTSGTCSISSLLHSTRKPSLTERASIKPADKVTLDIH